MQYTTQFTYKCIHFPIYIQTGYRTIKTRLTRNFSRHKMQSFIPSKEETPRTSKYRSFAPMQRIPNRTPGIK